MPKFAYSTWILSALLGLGLVSSWPAHARSFTVRSEFASVTVSRPSIQSRPISSSGSSSSRSPSSTSSGSYGVSAAEAQAAERARIEAERQARFEAANRQSDGLQAARAKGTRSTMTRAVNDSLAELRAAAGRGGEAAGAQDVRGSRSMAMLCFDTSRGCLPVAPAASSASVVDVRDIVGALQRDPLISEDLRRRVPEIRKLEEDRNAARTELAEVNQNLAQLQSQPRGNEVAIVEQKDKASKLETKIAWDNKQIVTYANSGFRPPSTSDPPPSSPPSAPGRLINVPTP